MSVTLKESPLDLYSVLQGKKKLITEIKDLQAKGYSLDEIMKHLDRMYGRL